MNILASLLERRKRHKHTKAYAIGYAWGLNAHQKGGVSIEALEAYCACPIDTSMYSWYFDQGALAAIRILKWRK